MATFECASLNFSIQTWYSRPGNVAPAPPRETLPLGTCGPAMPCDAGAPVPAAVVGAGLAPPPHAAATVDAARMNAPIRAVRGVVTRLLLQGPAVTRDVPARSFSGCTSGRIESAGQRGIGF